MAAIGAAAGGAPHRKRRVVDALGVVGLVVAADQGTKSWAVVALADGPIRLIGSTVELRLGRNSGGAFSSFQGATPVLAVVAAIAAVVLWRMAHRTPDRWMHAGLLLVLSGATGNLVDRIARDPGFLRGHVVDFVSVGWWPVFNVADAAITVGALTLLSRSWPAKLDPLTGSSG